MNLLSYLDRSLFELFRKMFTTAFVQNEDDQDFKKMRKGLITDYDVQEEPQKGICKVMSPRLDVGHLTLSMKVMDELLNLGEFNDKTAVG